MVARLHIAPLVLTLLAALAIIGPAAAHAQEGYTASAFACNNGNGGGNYDNAGTVYIACGNRVVRFTAAGDRLPDVTLNANTNSVAPSPDGRFIYVNTGGPLRRFSRTNNGGYAFDNAWVPQPVPAGATACNPTGLYEPRGRGISTDGLGHVYIAMGGWVGCTPSMVAKYDEQGRLVTVFGTHGEDLGQFNVAMGLAVSRNGRTIYTVENVTSRVQRFDWQPNGTYAFTMTWGERDEMYCRDGNFAAPYDVNVDPWGFVYVLGASCRRVQKFTANGQHLLSMVVSPPTGRRPHGVAVDGNGDIYVGEVNTKLTRTTPVPGPWPVITPLPEPDLEAPVLANVTVPAVIHEREFMVAIEATDNIGLHQVRMAREDGEWGPWEAWAEEVAHTVSAGFGIKAVTVQVRDAAGNESNMLTRALRYEPAGDQQDPVLHEVTLPATTTTAEVEIAIDATDDGGVTQVRVANEDGAWGPWRAFLTPLPHTLSAGLGIKGVFVQVADAGGRTSATLYRTTRVVEGDDGGNFGGGGDAGGGNDAPVDREDPVIEQVTLPAETDSRDVMVGIEATDNVGVTGVRTANEDGTWGAWRAFAAEVPHQLTAGFGFKAVFVQVRDGAGNTSTVRMVRTSYVAEVVNPGPGGGDAGAAPDAEAPVLHGLTLPAITATRTVTIAIDATDNVGVSGVRTANEDGNWGPWRAFAAEVGHELTAGFGTKGVFVQVRDAAGNHSNVLFRTLAFREVAPAPDAPADDEAPVLHAVTVPEVVGQRLVALTIEATDNVAVAQARTANEDGTWGPWRAFADELEHELSAGAGHKAVFVQVRDAAGNESNVLLVRTRVG